MLQMALTSTGLCPEPGGGGCGAERTAWRGRQGLSWRLHKAGTWEPGSQRWGGARLGGRGLCLSQGGGGSVVPWGEHQHGRSSVMIRVLPATFKTLESSIQGLRIM
ncbi:hypothetical protein MC885_018228 [Smutsia gigantea]|nr:hypothetical protein MC885_018228 [Smutsia gigantea]